jgi:hypothetical protein
VPERVANGFRQRGFGGDFAQAIQQPRFERVEQRLRLGLAHGQAFFGAGAADAGLDLVDGAKPLQRLGRDQAARGFMDFKKFTPRMGLMWSST